MESVLTNDDHDKTTSASESVSVGDSVPSSSSDANLKATVADTTQDDPISSTSDTINAQNLNLSITSVMELAANARNIESVSDSYFFSSELNMASISPEKISEDVEDIANDLENLLGEANNDYISSNSEKSFKIMSNERIDFARKIGSAALQSTSVVEQLELPNLDETNRVKELEAVVSGTIRDDVEKDSLDADKQSVDGSSDFAVAVVEDDSNKWIVEEFVSEGNLCLEDSANIAHEDTEMKIPPVMTDIAVKDVELERANVSVIETPVIEANDVIVDAVKTRDVDDESSPKIVDVIETKVENTDEGDEKNELTQLEKCHIAEDALEMEMTENIAVVIESSQTVASKSQNDVLEKTEELQLDDVHKLRSETDVPNVEKDSPMVNVEFDQKSVSGGVENANQDKQPVETNVPHSEISQDVDQGSLDKPDCVPSIVPDEEVNKLIEDINDSSDEIKGKPENDNVVVCKEQPCELQEGLIEDVVCTELNAGKIKNIPQLSEPIDANENNDGAQIVQTTLQVPDVDTSMKSLETISNIVSEMQETLMNLDRTDQPGASTPENSSNESAIESTLVEESHESIDKVEETTLSEELQDLLPVNSTTKAMTEVEELSDLLLDNAASELLIESTQVDELIELPKVEESSEPHDVQELNDSSKLVIGSSVALESESIVESTEASGSLENYDISSTANVGVEENTRKCKLREDEQVESPRKKFKSDELTSEAIISESVGNQQVSQLPHLIESTDTFELKSSKFVSVEEINTSKEECVSDDLEQTGNLSVGHFKENLDEQSVAETVNYVKSEANLDDQFKKLECGAPDDKCDEHDDQQMTNLDITEQNVQLESELVQELNTVEHVSQHKSVDSDDHEISMFPTSTKEIGDLEHVTQDKSNDLDDQKISLFPSTKEISNVELISQHKSDDLDEQKMSMFTTSTKEISDLDHVSQHKSDVFEDQQMFPASTKEISDVELISEHKSDDLDDQKMSMFTSTKEISEIDKETVEHINHDKSDVVSEQITNFPDSTKNLYPEPHTTKDVNLVEQQIINLIELTKDPVNLETLLVKNIHDQQEKVELEPDTVAEQIQQLLETADEQEHKVTPNVYVESQDIVEFLDAKQESTLDALLIEPNIELIHKEEIQVIDLAMADSHIQLLGLQEGVSITENEISEQIDLLMEKQCELQETTIEITQIQEEFDQNIELSAIIEEQIPLIDSTKKQDLYDAEADDVLTIEEISLSEIEESGIEELKRTCIVVEPDDEKIEDHVVLSEVEMVEVGQGETAKSDDDKFENLEFTQRDLIEDTIDAITKTGDDKLNKNLDLQGCISRQGLVSEAISSPKFQLETPLIIQVEDSAEAKPASENKDVHETKAISKYSSKMSSNQDLKMTITKHKGPKDDGRNKSDGAHSILKIYDPAEKNQSKESTVPKLIIKPVVRTSCKGEESEQTVPKITIKPIVERSDSQHSPKLIIKNLSPNRPASPKVVKKSEMLSPLKLTIKPVFKSDDKMSPKTRSAKQDDESVKITIKPIRPAQDEELSHNPKITIKPIIKPDESCETSPRITIKPIIKPDESAEYEAETSHSPRITIKPIVKPAEESVEIQHSPRITIKPIIKPHEESKEQDEEILRSPRITIKPIMKPSDEPKPDDVLHSPRITIKPIVKPSHDDVKQDSAGSPKITIKPIKHPDGENNSELIDFEDQIKQERIVLKINKSTMGKELRKREASEEIEKLGKIKLKFSKEGGHAHIVSEQGKLKRALEGNFDVETKRTRFETGDLTITPIEVGEEKKERMEPVKGNSVDISVVSSQLDDPLEKIPIFEITPESAAVMKNIVPAVPAQPIVPTPRKRGRPRKVPLVVREDFKDVKEEEAPPPPPLISEETGRPKRSCRGPSVRTTLGIRTRRPRGSNRGRGRGRGSRGGGSRGGRQQRVSAAKLKLLKEEAAAAIAEHSKKLDVDGGDVEMKEEQSEDVSTRTSDIVLIEEETRMSAEINNSRAQTPAKQVSTPGDVEDTQSSVQSTATTESVKVRKGPRMDVHQEPEGEVISAEQLAEYYWGGGGPFMLQEQVAQFLGIKSFKRKYPGINRRPVEMQERDFIRESGLASEAMCDLGLTCVNSADILDIMYSDFQNKYEEYCKHQRDRQAKDFTNKQKALSLAASQEKNKLDITQQAVQSAAAWNLTFNKARKEERKACMDLQTFTVHYPRGRFANIEKSTIGHYPVALVPGQFTDYYKTFTPTELNNLPLNTMLYNPINAHHDDSHTDGSASDTDSSSSDSDSSSSDSSDDDCNVCSPASSTTKKVVAN